MMRNVPRLYPRVRVLNRKPDKKLRRNGVAVLCRVLDPFFTMLGGIPARVDLGLLHTIEALKTKGLSRPEVLAGMQELADCKYVTYQGDGRWEFTDLLRSRYVVEEKPSLIFP